MSKTVRDVAIANLARWRANPIDFVREQFGAEPDEWQKDALRLAATGKKLALAACKGPGKSCVLAWIVWWFLSTHVNSQIVTVSITADNLKDGLWKELAIWRSKSALLQSAFGQTAEKIFNPGRERMWWVSARAFAQNADQTQQTSTLAGLHNPDVMIVLDEIGDYPPGVLPAAEAIFATEGQNAKLVVAGNPTSMQGPLYQIVAKDASRWNIINITGDPDDPKRSPRISKKWAEEEITKWGRDNPYVMVNILGQFPPVSENQLISINDVVAAMSRDMPFLSYRSDPIIWGLDPSRSIRSGADEAALARRQGLLTRKFHTWRGMDGPQLAAAVSRLIIDAEKAGEKPDAIFVDVGGVGASCFDHLKLMGWHDIVIPIDFGSAPDDRRFANKRTEMWWHAAEHVHMSTACLPNDPVFQEELVAPTFSYRVINKTTCLMLETKDELKERGVRSPNRADAWSLTFARPMNPIGRHHRDLLADARPTRVETEYDPFARI